MCLAHFSKFEFHQSKVALDMHLGYQMLTDFFKIYSLDYLQGKGIKVFSILTLSKSLWIFKLKNALDLNRELITERFLCKLYRWNKHHFLLGQT